MKIQSTLTTQSILWDFTLASLKMKAKEHILQDFPSSSSRLHCTAWCSVPEAAVSQQPVGTSNVSKAAQHIGNSSEKLGC